MRNSREDQCVSTISGVLVQRWHGHGSAKLTGIGFVDLNVLVAPGDSSHSYLESLDGLEHHTLKYCLESWTYAFHDACWEVLLMQLSRASTRPSQDLDLIGRHLFNLLHCLPSDRRSITFPAHDFGGAFRFWNNPLDIPGDWRFLWAEPKVPCFAPTRPVHRPFHDDPTVSFDPLPSSDSCDCFARLPSNVIFSIINSLSSADLCSSRQSSRTLATLTAPGYLPQSFWRSRFLQDKELGFLCPTQRSSSLSRGIDWEELYHVVKVELNNMSETGHLRNRSRVWCSLRHLTNCLAPLLDQKFSLLPPDASDQHLTTQGYVLGHVVRGYARHDSKTAGSPRGVGSRLLGVNHIFFDFQFPEAATFEIKVSFLVFNCVAYVCGLRYLRQDGSRCGLEISRIGLIIPSAETALEVDSRDHLSGIRVATTLEGVIGLAFIFNRDGAEKQVSVGVVKHLPQTAGLATLRPQSGRKIAGVEVGFDVRNARLFPRFETPINSQQACKVVSLQLIELLSEEQQNTKNPTEEQLSDLAPVPMHLFHPSESTETSTLSADLPTTPSQPYLFLNMNLGGSDGCQVSSLTRVVAYHDDLRDCIRGFAFHFADGSSEMYGITDIASSAADRWTCTEESVAIGGPDGERITSLQYVLPDERSNNRVKCVKVRHTCAQVYLKVCS